MPMQAQSSTRETDDIVAQVQSQLPWLSEAGIRDHVNGIGRSSVSKPQQFVEREDHREDIGLAPLLVEDAAISTAGTAK